MANNDQNRGSYSEAQRLRDGDREAASKMGQKGGQSRKGSSESGSSDR